MLKLFSKYKFCVSLIVIILLVSICLVPFTTSVINFFGWFSIPTGTLLVLLPIILGVTYAIVVSCEPEQMDDKKRKKFSIAYACIFIGFYILNIATIVYAIMKMMR